MVHKLTVDMIGVESVALVGNTLVTSSYDSNACIWNATSGVLQRKVTGSIECGLSVALAGNTLVTGSMDDTVRI